MVKYASKIGYAMAISLNGSMGGEGNCYGSLEHEDSDDYDKDGKPRKQHRGFLAWLFSHG